MWSEESIRALAPWADLTHAYGTADDLPRYLAALLGAEQAPRREAHDYLRSSVVHQESRWSASPHVVPFLSAVVRDESTPDRPEILELLGLIAIGDEGSWLNREIALTEIRRILEQEPDAKDAYECEWWEIKSYDAVHAEVPGYLPLLRDTDPAVRSWAAFLLSWFPDSKDAIVAALEDTLTDEVEESVRATIYLALGIVGTTSRGSLFRALSSSAALERWCAAIGLALLGQGTEGAVARELSACVGSASDSPYPIPYNEGRIRDFAEILAEPTDDPVLSPGLKG